MTTALHASAILGAIAVMVSATHPSRAVAQNEGNAAVVLELPANTRALALGNAFVLSGTNPDAIFYNAALLSQVSGASIGLQRFGSGAALLTAASSTDGFAFGIQALTYGAPSPDLLLTPVGVSDLTTDNPIAASELVGSLGYGTEVFGFAVGVVAKWIHQRVGSGRGASAAADIGVFREIDFLNIGLTLQNVGPDVTLGGDELPLPRRFGVGISTDVEQVGPLDVALTSSIFRQHDGGIMAGGGVEVAFWPIVGRTFTARIGGLHEPHTKTFFLTVGGAITLDNATGDYAFQGISSSGSGHRGSVRWR